MRRQLVKICGISTSETLDAAIAGGASHIGFNHFAKSPRFVGLEQMAALRRAMPRDVAAVVLLVDPTTELVREVMAHIAPDAIQLHGHELPDAAAAWRQTFGVAFWKAVPIRTAADLAAIADWVGLASRILYDAKPPEGAILTGGNGLRFDWTLLSGHRHAADWGLAGGLDAANVAEAIRMTGAPLVDVSSGVETAPGIKDVDKIAAFLKAANP